MSKVEQILQLIQNETKLLKLIRSSIILNIENLPETEIDKILQILTEEE